jgi:hypothetical protein
LLAYQETEEAHQDIKTNPLFKSVSIFIIQAFQLQPPLKTNVFALITTFSQAFLLFVQ